MLLERILWYNSAMLFRLNRVLRAIVCQHQILAVLAVVAVGTLVWLTPVSAGWAMNQVADLLASIAQIIIELVGKIFTVLIEILLAVVDYNDFINAPAVIKGWVLVRDVANMAFLIIFIAIAFATILGIEKYEYKQLLPKLLIMAVLVNFSRTICGIIIDAAQVVMMTFVNGFKDVAAGNLIRGFGITDMLTLRDLGETEGVTGTALAAASILAVAMLVIATVTVGIMVLMFVIRIIYLWILIVLSPFAFMLSAAPGFSGKFNEWWDKFARYVFIGPLLAFFLWLSFSIMSSVDPGQNLATQNKINFGSTTSAVGMAGRTSASITAVSRSDNLLSFGIAIALLMLALSTANSIGVAGGKLAGSAMAKIQSGGIKLGKIAGLGVLGGLPAIAGGTLLGTQKGRQALDWVNRWQALRGGFDLNLKRQWKGMKEGFAERKKREEMGISVKAFEKMKEGGLLAVAHAFLGGGRDAAEMYVQGAFNLKGFRNIWRTIVGGPGTVEKIQKKAADEKLQAEIAQKRYAMRDEALKKENLDEEGTKAFVEEHWQGRAKRNQEDDQTQNVDEKDKYLFNEDGKKVYLKAELKTKAVEVLGADSSTKDRESFVNKTVDELETDDPDIAEKKREYLNGKDGKGGWEERRAKSQLAQEVKAAREYKGSVKTPEGERHQKVLQEVQKLGQKFLQAEAEKKDQESQRLAKGGLSDAEKEEREKGLKNIVKELERIDRDIRRNDEMKLGLDVSALEDQKKELEDKRAQIAKEEKDADGKGTNIWKVKEVVNVVAEAEEKVVEAKKKEAAAKTKDEKNKATKEREEAENEHESLKKSLEEGGERKKMSIMAGLEKERLEMIGQALSLKPEEREAQRAQWEKEKEDFKTQASQHAVRANAAEQRARKYIPPRAFYAERNRRLLEDDEMKKITSKLDTELIADFKDAVADGNSVKAVALAKKLANDYNDNELWNAYGFDSTSLGMQKFIDAVLMGKKDIIKDSDGAVYRGPSLGMDDQTALSIENEISYINESRKHWETARTIKVENGQFKRMSDLEHTQATLAEIVKGDSSEMIRGLNRLAYGGERPRADGSGRDFILRPLGAGILSAFAPEFHFRFGRGEYNKNAILNLYQELKKLRELGLPPELLHETEGKGRKVVEEGGKSGPDIARNMFYRGKGIGIF
ncbi:MAG: hypothetical protein A3H70_04430 [Candidatus Komeilibacteria bacterium RIFCSPLOWO2_02_FULL_48_11]|uniref:Uncharacterized protein n=1 Tax=Candidatus Komeilibacteria bacterium RIFCSPLOWO2_02_FULL_48_11 TaxID=1798553 RepID=A0A1G2BUG0_9BACT|nr:MAG: hypothetical protein A3H70_04430 [Candidatus Komeilibacteria bacterium RIFCSPLOWO2_02_FULL_48_11]